MLLRRILLFILVFVIGAACGTLGLETFHRSHDSSVLFERKLKCQSLARDFVKRRTSDFTHSSLQRADYSPARASCIAEVNDTFTRPDSANPLWSFNVFDVVTGEVLFATSCSDAAGDCGSRAGARQDDAFINALHRAGKP